MHLSGHNRCLGVVCHSWLLCIFVSGTARSFVLRARDEFNNDRMSGGDDVGVSLLRQGHTAVEVMQLDHENGSYTIEFNATASGSYSLAVTIGNATGSRWLAGSPFALEVNI